MITKTRNVESATETRETQSIETEVKLAEVYESPVDLKTIEQEISDKVGVFETDAAEARSTAPLAAVQIFGLPKIPTFWDEATSCLA